MQQSQPDLNLTLFPLDSPKDWHLTVGRALEKISYGVVGGANHLQAWEPTRATKLRPNLYLNVGWSLKKTWLSPRSHGLTTIPRKLYFSDPSDQQPIAEREDVILAGRARPPLPSVDRVIGGCLDLARALSDHGAIASADPVPIGAARHAVQRDTAMIFGGNARIPATVTEKEITAALRRSGPHRVPSGFRIVIVTDEAEQEAARQYAMNVCEWLRSFRLARTPGEAESMVTAFSLRKVTERLEQRLAMGEDSTFEGRAVLVALSGKPGTAIPQQQTRFLELLAHLSIPFRCFSLDNNNLKWSTHTQLLSLLQAARGVPYGLHLPMPPELENVAFLGIDLGHPKDREESWLVVSLVDRHGSLIGAYRCRQRRDETASPELLATGLDWARGKMETMPYEPAGVVVMRDGRMHTGERMDAYRNHLGPNTTLIEVTKNDNPAMFEAGSRPRYAPEGSVVHPLDSSVRFLCPTGQVMDGQGLPRVLKLQLRDDCDGLKLGLDSMTSIVAGLVCAPSLGTKAHALPGPIYWADGIARSAPHTYKFAGLPVTTPSGTRSSSFS